MRIIFYRSYFEVHILQIRSNLVSAGLRKGIPVFKDIKILSGASARREIIFSTHYVSRQGFVLVNMDPSPASSTLQFFSRQVKKVAMKRHITEPEDAPYPRSPTVVQRCRCLQSISIKCAHFF